jgi:hypothetical protein
MRAFLLCCIALWPLSGAAVEELVIGRGGLSFKLAREESNRLSVAADSLWIWQAERGENIAPLVLARGGRIFSIVWKTDALGQVYPALSGAQDIAHMIDGDEHTAFDPDVDGLSREMDIYIDLGAHYGVEQIRFFPRLDSEHRDRYLQAFQLGSDRLDPSEIETDIFDVCCGSPNLVNAHINAPNNQSVVLWPHPNEPHDPRPMRHVRLRTLNQRPWEVAEIEIIADGSAPPGEYVSAPMEVRNARPVWGRFLVDGESPESLPITVQTRSGPDLSPVQYFVMRGFDLVLVSASEWATAIPGIQAPPQPNPEWSAWEALSDGQIVSPPRAALQFRLQILQPGTRIERVAIEYASRLLAQELSAEIYPSAVEPGAETAFALDLRARRIEDVGGVDSGFRYIEINTSAEVVGIDSVYVQDRPVFYSVEERGGDRLVLRLTERVAPEGSFVQIFFRARVFVDGTRFSIRALDRRPTGEGDEEVYQTARAADVEPRTPGGTLSVRLSSRREPLIDDVAARTQIFTPNGDGRHDYFVLSYNLLRLTQPASAFFEIYDLSGRLVRRGHAGQDRGGSYLRLWDGLSFDGYRVPPGMYIYRVSLEADAKKAARQGLVHVVY